jgi:hypothetical protein
MPPQPEAGGTYEYYALAQASRDEGKKIRAGARAQPPVMNYPEPYRFKVKPKGSCALSE